LILTTASHILVQFLIGNKPFAIAVFCPAVAGQKTAKKLLLGLLRDPVALQRKGEKKFLCSDFERRGAQNHCFFLVPRPRAGRVVRQVEFIVSDNGYNRIKLSCHGHDFTGITGQVIHGNPSLSRTFKTWLDRLLSGVGR
jgi:hypothetical protein